jgi:KipI family sensor histidine kinase inhibitor
MRDLTAPPPSTAQAAVHAEPVCWRWVGERGLRIETGDATLARYALLAGQEFPELEDLVPADGSLLLVLRRGAQPSASLRAALVADRGSALPAGGTLHEIAVAYGGPDGPDLPALARQAGLDEAAYIRQHAAAEYGVAFLGFQPGFPYLRGLPEALHAPRRSSPRARVDAGSVAVGGSYCGIYPASGPGGWHVIGRASVSLFDPRREPPALLRPGDRVRFVPE